MTRCPVSYPHPPHDKCDGSAGKPWPFPLGQPKCGQCNDTGWLHGAQEWTPKRMSKGTPYKSVRCDCQRRRGPHGENSTKEKA